MKRVGQTNDGMELVAMTPNEVQALRALVDALGDKDVAFHDQHMGYSWDWGDITNYVEAIHKFAGSLTQIQSAKRLLEKFEQRLAENGDSES